MVITIAVSLLPGLLKKMRMALIGEYYYEIFFRVVELGKNTCSHAFSEEFLPLFMVSNQRYKEHVLSV